MCQLSFMARTCTWSSLLTYTSSVEDLRPTGLRSHLKECALRGSVCSSPSSLADSATLHLLADAAPRFPSCLAWNSFPNAFNILPEPIRAELQIWRNAGKKVFPVTWSPTQHQQGAPNKVASDAFTTSRLHVFSDATVFCKPCLHPSISL